MFCLSFRCEFRFEMFCLLMRTNECVGVKAWVGCSATGFPLSFIIIILCDPAGGLHNNPHKMTKIEDPKAARSKSKPKKKKNPNRNDPKTGLLWFDFGEWQMHLRLGSEILSRLKLMGLNVMTINWFHDYGNSIWNLWMVIMQFEVI